MGFKKAKAAKQRQRQEALDNARQKLASLPAPAHEAAILAASAGEIGRRCGAGEWRALDVVVTYGRRALTQNETLNFITECRLVEAIDEARALDERFAADKKPVGELHGVACSIKDQFDIRGLDSSVGVSRYCDAPAAEDATLVHLLRKHGAVIMFKTNVPQTLMTNESSNPIFGVTGNPRNPAYTCGGSSGGEGACLGSNSSALGVGTDIAGSLRYPSHFSGGYSLKPSEERWPRNGIFDFDRTSEQMGVKPVAGPMARNVDDIDLLWRLVVQSEPWRYDAKTLRLPYVPYEVAKGRKLRFAYYLDDTFSTTSPACRRAVKEAVAALEAQGHTCELIVPPRVKEAVECFVALTSADGNAGMKDFLGDDPWERNVAMELVFPPLPRMARAVLAKALDVYYKDRQFTDLLRNCGKQSWDELSKWNWLRGSLRQHWLDTVWRAKGAQDVDAEDRFDAIVCPVYPLPAVKHGETREILPVAATTYLYNLLDYPAGVVPATLVDAARDDHAQVAEYQGWQGVFHAAMYQGFMGSPPVYNATDMHGLNVGVQIVCNNLCEEKCITMMRVVDDAIKAAGGPH